MSIAEHTPGGPGGHGAEDTPLRRRKTLCLCALIAALVLAIFGKTLLYGFVYDDALYVTDNAIVQKGLSLQGIPWAFTFGEIGHWHPLTWFTHMLDCQLYGLHAWGHHLTNVILHALAAALLFLVLRELIGDPAKWGRCAFVAAAWAVHPLRAESVAWVSERKDVLSGLFFMLALLAYARSVRAPSAARRAWVAALFALGLMSKDMLVTFPFVLLLLDYWPLGRLGAHTRLAPLLKEKIPLFALSLASCAATFLVPEKVTDAHTIPLSLRMENALVSYCIYLRQSIWPAGLSANYPNPTHPFPAWQVAGAIALLCAITAAAIALRKNYPWLLVGWLWFAGMLVPVSGLVQISHYAHADRYTYLPQIGLWIAATWTVCEAGGKWLRNGVSCAAAASILVALSWATCIQLTYWRDDITLWTHALECNPADGVAHTNLGLDLLERGDADGAIAHLKEALRLDPAFERPHLNLGIALERTGDIKSAMDEYRKVLRINPNYSEAYERLGQALQRQGDYDSSITNFKEAIRTNPRSPEAYYDLGSALLQQQKYDEAMENFRKAEQLDPTHAETRTNLGNALAAESRTAEAIAEYREAIRIDPNEANAHYNLANALFAQGHGAEAIAESQKALAMQPGNTFYQNDLALMLSMSPDHSLRDGPTAVELATKANQATGGNNPLILRTLAAAYAETGDFTQAIATASKAMELLETHPAGGVAVELRRELDLYKSGRKFENGARAEK